MFRTIAIVVVLAACAFMAGWFTIDRDEQETTIRINRDEIRSDASEALAKGKEFLEANRSVQTDEESQAETDWQFPQPVVEPETIPQQATRPIPPWQLPQQGTGNGQF